MKNVKEESSRREAFHKAGDLERAEQAYGAVLRSRPTDAQACFLLRVVCQATGRLETETVADDLAQYVVIAVSLAGDPRRLAELRATLRPRMAQSPLCDGPRFARRFLDALRNCWRVRCANRSA